MNHELVRFDETHIYHPSLSLSYLSLPINRTARSCHMWVNSLPPFCCRPHLHPPPTSALTSPPLILSSLPPFPLLERFFFLVVGVTLYEGQRGRVLSANRKSGGSLFADQWRPYVFLWKIQPDNRRIRGEGSLLQKNNLFFFFFQAFKYLSGLIFHYLFCSSKD